MCYTVVVYHTKQKPGSGKQCCSTCEYSWNKTRLNKYHNVLIQNMPIQWSVMRSQLLCGLHYWKWELKLCVECRIHCTACSVYVQVRVALHLQCNCMHCICTGAHTIQVQVHRYTLYTVQVHTVQVHTVQVCTGTGGPYRWCTVQVCTGTAAPYRCVQVQVQVCTGRGTHRTGTHHTGVYRYTPYRYTPYRYTPYRCTAFVCMLVICASTFYNNNVSASHCNWCVSVP